MGELYTGTLVLCSTVIVISATYPPFFVQQSEVKQLIFEVGTALELPCVADADPSPMYRWEFNGKPFAPDGQDDNVVMSEAVGSLLFSRPGSANSGFYKCFATNSFGTAVSNTVQLINASLGTFSHQPNYPMHKTAGHPLRIICNQPESFPAAIIVWFKKVASGEEIVNYDDRVTDDPYGGLNFAFLKSEDTGEYVCSAYNMVLRKSVTSKPFNLTVLGYFGHVMLPPSRAYWDTRTSLKFVRGRPASIKCIYSGNPTPSVLLYQIRFWYYNYDWIGRPKVRSYGMELYYESIEYEDAGLYVCYGDSPGMATSIRTTIKVEVEGHVRWVYKPTSVTKGENGTATFVCIGEGRPRPNPPRWFINGEPFQATARRFVGNRYGLATTLTIQNLQKDLDTMAIQCNITNGLSGSWVHASFYLNVTSDTSVIGESDTMDNETLLELDKWATTTMMQLDSESGEDEHKGDCGRNSTVEQSEASNWTLPTIEEFDKELPVWTEGRSYYLRCKAVGYPTPIISWMKDDQPTYWCFYEACCGDHTLKFRPVDMRDAGNYTCTARNELGSVNESTSVIVKKLITVKTVIEHQKSPSGAQAKGACTTIPLIFCLIHIMCYFSGDFIPL